jgi:GMP synthase-like glutamine amidotransferase
MGMKIAIFQHVKREPTGFLASFFAEQGIPLEYIRLYETNELRETDATHFIFLGGPMSVNDDPVYPWLAEEKALIRRAVCHHQKVLGVCLGAQLIASAFGAKVYPFIRETGWCPVRCEPVKEGAFSQFPDRFTVFQLHGETFEIPYKGRLLCTGDTVRNQAFAYKTALGLQFHVELTAPIIQDWCRDLTRFRQEKILRETPRYLAESNRLCRIIGKAFITG